MNLGAPARTATLKALLSQRLRERLVQPRCGKPGQAQLYRAACHADRHGNRSVRAAALKLQAQNLTHPSHRGGTACQNVGETVSK